MKTIYLQTAETLEDFEALASRVSNMLDAECIVHRAAKVIGENTRYWKREFCQKYFNRFAKSECFQILMGEMEGDKREYHYVPNKF